jgi:glyoxylase-like metal-dependent hydrolase (beta-lactamase superfamily II)
MPLEDDLCDIIKKARVGIGSSIQEIAKASGLTEAEIAGLERGKQPCDRAQLRKLAESLELRPEPLARIAIERWEPHPQTSPAWVDTIYGSVGGYGVQGYLLRDGAEAIAVDTGYNAKAMIAALDRQRLRLVAICLTHGHADHAEGINELLAYREVPVYLGEADRDLLDWRPPSRLLSSPGDRQPIRVGCREVRALLTPGHTPGGTCYLVDDAEQPLCFVGDTLFAGSIGRSNPRSLYRAHLGSVRTKLLTFPSYYRLYPGHGPMTTVGEELAHNPFGSPR